MLHVPDKQAAGVTPRLRESGLEGPQRPLKPPHFTEEESEAN